MVEVNRVSPINHTARTEPAVPKIITVDKNGTADYTGIQDAINASNNGDTIIVHSGTYYENVNLNRRITMRGGDTGGGKPIVDGRGIASTITLSADGIMLEGFSVVNSSNWPGAGIKVTSDNNTITGNAASNRGYGIYLASSGYNSITANDLSNNYKGIYLEVSSYNDINDNTACSSGYGIYLVRSSYNTISGNNASNNIYDGIYLDDTSYNNVTGNRANNNNNGITLYRAILGTFGTDSSSIPSVDSSNNTIVGNTASSNKYGVYLYESNYTNITNNTISNNTYYGIYLYNSSNNNIYNNLFNNSDNFRMNNSVNRWNITRTSVNNIMGGPYTGGNAYMSPTGTGFSQTCVDADSDEICDMPFSLAGGDKDYLPLASPQGLINGTIKDSVTGNGIAGAVITTGTHISAIANGSGFYSLRVPAGTYNLTARSEPGYCPNSSVTVTAVVDIPTIQDFMLTLKPTGTITGTVIN